MKQINCNGQKIGRRAIAWFIVVATLLLVPASALSRDKDFFFIRTDEGDRIKLYKKSHALLIANSDYQQGWTSLPFATLRVAEIARVLIAHDFTVQYKKNLTAEEFANSFYEFIEIYGQDTNTRLVFYFVGHGYTVTSDGDDEGYLVMHDTPNAKHEEFEEDALPMSSVYHWCRNVNARHLLLFFDCCLSDSAIGLKRDVNCRPVDNYTKKRNFQFIVAGQKDERITVKNRFFRTVVDLLSGTVPEPHKDNYLTGTEIAFHLVKTFSKEAGSTHPSFTEDNRKGDIVFHMEKSAELLASMERGDSGSSSIETNRAESSSVDEAADVPAAVDDGTVKELQKSWLKLRFLDKQGGVENTIKLAKLYQFYIDKYDQHLRAQQEVAHAKRRIKEISILEAAQIFDLKRVKLSGYFNDSTRSYVDLFKKYNNDLLVMHFWRSNCLPCIREMPKLKDFNKKNKDKGILFIGVSSDVDKEKIKKIMDHAKVEFPMFYDKGDGLLEKLTVNREVPLSVLTSADGDIIDIILGAYDWDKQSTIDYFKQKYDRYRQEKK